MRHTWKRNSIYGNGMKWSVSRFIGVNSCFLWVYHGVSYWHLLAHDFVLYYCTTREIIKESRTVLRYPEDGMILRDIFPFIHYHLEPQTTIYKWMFQLDDSKSLYGKWLFHQTSIYKWLFGVPGSNVISTSPSVLLRENWPTPAPVWCVFVGQLQPTNFFNLKLVSIYVSIPQTKKVASLTTIRGFSPPQLCWISVVFKKVSHEGEKMGG